MPIEEARTSDRAAYMLLYIQGNLQLWQSKEPKKENLLYRLFGFVKLMTNKITPHSAIILTILCKKMYTTNLTFQNQFLPDLHPTPNSNTTVLLLLQRNSSSDSLWTKTTMF